MTEGGICMSVPLTSSSTQNHSLHTELSLAPQHTMCEVQGKCTTQISFSVRTLFVALHSLFL